MRVISGKYKGKRFAPPKKFPSRPTTDFAKESLFNILNNSIDFENIHALDLFSGTGSIGIELISREAKSVTSVDIHATCVKHIHALKTELNEKNWHIVKADVFEFLSNHTTSYDLIIADPPYDLKRVPELPNLIFKNNLLNQGGIFVLEHGREHSFENETHFTGERNYGGVHFSFFEL